VFEKDPDAEASAPRSVGEGVGALFCPPPNGEEIENMEAEVLL